MWSYFLKCRKGTESKNPKVVRAKNERIILLSKCRVFNSKNPKFLKEQEAKGLLSKLMGIIFMKIFITKRNIYARNTFKTTWIHI